MLTKIGQRFMNGLTMGVARPQATQRSYNGVDPFRGIAQDRAQCFYTLLVYRRSLTIGGAKRGPEMLSGMIEIQDLITKRQHLAKIAPVVRGAIGHFDHP